jgi:hypothetical protein
MDTNSPFELVVSKIEAENIVNRVRSLIPVNYLENGMGGSRTEEFKSSGAYRVQNSDCRFWCRSRGSESFISLLNWTEVGLNFFGVTPSRLARHGRRPAKYETLES